MTNPNPGTRPIVWMAIDIAKNWNAALVEHPDGRHQRFRFRHSADEYDRLVQFLRDTHCVCRIAFEPTGDYHRLLGYRLLHEGFEVCQISSVAGARYRDAMFNSWDKNDPKDAEVILRLLKQGITQRYYDPLINGTHDLKELSKVYQQVARARARVRHRIITHYLALYFPEIERYWYSSRNDWFVQFLLQFPTPDAIRAMSRDQFVAAAWNVVGRKVGKRQQLEELHGIAQRSIGLPVAAESPAIEAFRLQLASYHALNEQRTLLEERAHALLQNRHDYQRLRELPGIGPIIALVILAEAGDLRRFGHYQQFLKFCGLDLAKVQSGVSRGQERLAKRGNARLRCALWQAATVAIRMRENAFRDKYARYVAADPTSADLRRKAHTAVTAKMARVAYALVKFDRPYRGRFEVGLPSGSIPLTATLEAIGTS
jgi:transposase